MDAQSKIHNPAIDMDDTIENWAWYYMNSVVEEEIDTLPGDSWGEDDERTAHSEGIARRIIERALADGIPASIVTRIADEYWAIRRRPA